MAEAPVPWIRENQWVRHLGGGELLGSVVQRIRRVASQEPLQVAVHELSDLRQEGEH